MSLLPSRIALVVAAALLSLLAAATTASADLRIPTLGEATTLSTMPDSVSWGSAMASDGNATFVAFSESAGGIMFQRIGAAGTEFSSQLSIQGQGTASIGAPRIAVTGDTVHVAWLQSSYFTREVHATIATSRDGGRTFSTPVVASRPTGHGAWGISIGADGDNVFVAWSDDRDRLWTAGSRDGGRTFVCQAIITGAGVPTEGGAYDIAVDGPRVHWAWMSEGFDIYTRRSTDAGRTLEPPTRVRDADAADYAGAPNIDASGGIVAITSSQLYRMPRPDKTGTDFGHQPVLSTSQDGGRTWAEQNIGSPSDRCIGDYCSAPYSLAIDGLDVYVGWRGQGQMWLGHSADGGVMFDNAKAVGPYSYTWHTQQMPSVDARGDTVVMAWHTAPRPDSFDMDPIAAFSSDRGKTFTLRTIDDRAGQDLGPGGVAWGPDPQGAGFAWMSFERSIVNGDRNVRFKPLSASEPDVAVLEVAPVQAAKDAALLAAGRPTTIRAKLRSAAPARSRVPLDIELAYDDENGERVERTLHQDVVLKPGTSTIQLLADDPIAVGRGRITAKVAVSPDLYDSDHSNDRGEGSRAVADPRPLTVLFVPVAASDELRPACENVKDVAAGFEEHALQAWPVNPRYLTVLEDCSAPIVHDPGITDAGLMGPRGLLARLDRQKWSGLAIDKVVGVTPRGWFSRQEIPALKQAVGVAPLGGTMDAAIVERQNTGGWVVGHELAHQLGWTEEAGPHGNHLEAAPAPGYWADGRKDIPETTLDFMHFSTAGADERRTTDRWISKATWDFLVTKLASSAMGATAQQGLAAAADPGKTLSLTGTVKADGSVVAGDMAEVEGEPDPGAGEGPYSFEQLDAGGAVLQTRRFSISHDMGPIGGETATGDEHAVAADAAFSLRVPALAAARTLRIRKDDRPALWQRTRSGSAPAVDVTAPAAGAKIGLNTDMTISWNASDADGDALTHFVALSTDGGDTWKTVGDGVGGTSLTVRTGLDINGADVRVRVTTTDGWNTVTDVSSPFSIGGQLSDGLIAFNDWGSRSAWTADLDGTGAKQIATNAHHPSWSPDGTRLAWDNTELFTAKPDGTDKQQVTHLGTGRFWKPLWADDHTLLAKRENTNPWGNMLVDTATGDATIFPAQYADLCDVAPSGRVIGRYGLYEDSWSIWSSTGDKVDEQRAMKSCGSFSPDGRYAVGTRYRSDADSRIDVVVYDFQTKTQRNLTNGTFGGYNAYPTWSPTGEWIIWGSNKDRSGSTGFGATDLWRIRPDGTDAKKIVDGTKFGSAGTGFMNFEAPDVQPVRGFAPEPEPTREELQPVAKAAAAAGAEGAQIELDASASAPGADGAAISGYAWDLDGDGAYDDATGAAPKASFPDEGTYAVAVQVTDAKGRSDTAAADVKVANAAPAISGARVGDGDPAAFTATITDASVQDVQTATLDWGEGSAPETVPVIAGDGGSALVSATHPVPGATVELTVSDGDGGQATASALRVLAPANAAPTADDAAASVRQGETVDVDLPATDPEGDRLEYLVVDEPAHGRISTRALDPLAPEQPEVTYVADSAYTGADTFTYKVTDGTGSSRTATVAVTVKPLPADEGGPEAPAPDPQLPAPEAPSEPAPRGPGREGSTPIDQQKVEDATDESGPRGAAPKASQILTLPSAKRCVSRRKFRIRVKRMKNPPAQGAYKRVEVAVDGKRTRVVRGVRDTATVDLRGLPKGRFKVRITVTLADGRKVTSTRRYRTCATRKSTPKKKGARL